jgi:hypothetical protein
MKGALLFNTLDNVFLYFEISFHGTSIGLTKPCQSLNFEQRAESVLHESPYTGSRISIRRLHKNLCMCQSSLEIFDRLANRKEKQLRQERGGKRVT